MSEGAHPARDPAGAALSTYYFAWLGALGAFGPFVASFLAERGFSSRAAAWTLAAMPLVRVLVTPAWTFAADLLRSPAAVLRAVSLASLAAFVGVALAGPPWLVAAALLLYTAFRAPTGSLADSLALAWSARSGAAFGRVRVWGSVGFLLAALAVGALLTGRGSKPALALTAALLAVGVACTFALPGAPSRASEPLLPALRGLVREPRVVRLAAAGVLHQVGLAPYDALFPTYLARRANGLWAGAAVAVGVACEVAVMLFARRWIARVGHERAIALSFAVSALRWLVVARAESVPVLVAAQSLHAFSFATYYLAAVSLLDEVSPAEVRASAQGIHTSAVFGAGGALSLALAGALGGVEGVRAVFTAGAAASALAALVMWPRLSAGGTRAGSC